MTFGLRAQVIQDIRQPVAKLEAAFKTITASGTSVFFDAMIQGMAKVSRSDQQRKALIVFSDGNDNGSKSGFGDVSHAAQRTNVLLYFVPIGAKRLIDQYTVESLAKLTGGQVLYLEKTDSIRPIIESIRTDLAKQYYLGYYAARRPGIHRIRVEIPGSGSAYSIQDRIHGQLRSHHPHLVSIPDELLFRNSADFSHQVSSTS
jgi:hypothetical protein